MGVRSRVWLVVGLLAPVLLGFGASAQTPERPEWTIFAGLDVRGDALFASAGFKVAPLERLGNRIFVMQALGGGGRCSYASDRWSGRGRLKDTRFVALQASAQASLGPVYVAAFLGPEWHDEAPAARLARNPDDGSRIGLRGQFDLWSYPTSSSLVTGVIIASSARPSVYARVSAGVALAEGVYASPKASLSAGRDYDVGRFGVHFTGLRLFGSHSILGGGAAFEAGRKPGAYGSLVHVWRF